MNNSESFEEGFRLEGMKYLKGIMKRVDNKDVKKGCKHKWDRMRQGAWWPEASSKSEGEGASHQKGN